MLASIFEVPLDEVPDPRWPDDILWREGQEKTLTARGHLARETRAQAFPGLLGPLRRVLAERQIR